MIRYWLLVAPLDKMRQFAPKFLLILIFAGLGLLFSFILPSTSAPTTTTDQATTMNWFQAVVLGIVQGVTEFLPISSSAHLKVVPVVLGWGDPGLTFTAVIHLGSIVAIIWYFRRDLLRLMQGTLQAIQTQDYYHSDFRLTVGILLATVPILICGMLWKQFVTDDSPVRSMTTIAITSVVIGLLLGVAENVGKRSRSDNQLKPIDAILMGVAQALALIPGTSRSGITITAGLFLGLERPTAARFALLMGIPTIVLAGLVELVDVVNQGWNDTAILPLAIGTLTTFICSYFSVVALIAYLQRQSTWVFVWYRVIFGGLIMLGVIFNQF